MLKLTNVNAYYGDMEALSEVSFEIEEGQIVSMVGSNGAGKSTTLNVISGVVQCSAGSIVFLGNDITHLPPHKIVELGIIQIPEARLLFPDMTVLENLELGAFNSNARQQKEENLQGVFELFPVLQDRKYQLAGTLSGGEQQMLAIARGLMAKPKLLMLDEPSLGLAPILVKHVFETIEEINSHGITVFLVEQNVFHSLSISDKAYVLENGRIVLGGDGKELLENPKVKEAYLGI
ncbi:MAG: ABC transporter ATP-binding protein [Deltaproteobacteria bacterium]|nr:ABC transporter ATP-binding protein [Deltaproteobacteria bacterium]MBW1961893.1 ABC transporter ATP-binding protein [Deltaproteobacteria bacterium]MBW2153620.1 ABC transporter ATP-binding protein [Deltaproteobacteria bacterium]